MTEKLGQYPASADSDKPEPDRYYFQCHGTPWIR